MLLLTVCSTCIRFLSTRKHRKTFHHPNKGRPSSTQTKEENKPSSPQRKKIKCQHSKKGRKQNFQHTNKGGKQNFQHFVYSFAFLSVLRGHSFFFIPATTANGLRLRRSFYPRFYPLHFICPILIIEKEPVFSLVNFQC